MLFQLQNKDALFDPIIDGSNDSTYLFGRIRLDHMRSFLMISQFQAKKITGSHRLLTV